LLDGLDFGRQRGEGGAIEGLAFRDQNGNRQRDAGEPALANWTIFLDSNGNARLDAGERLTKTDAQGNYRFDNLPTGRYYIAQFTPQGWTQTLPALADGTTQGIYWFADVAGQPMRELNFATRAETTPPTSTVAPLPPVVHLNRVPVRWAGDDGPSGTGIATFDIYVSRDGGPFNAWQTSTQGTEALFDAEAGHTYGFYSIATDAAGNRQAIPGGPQAVTFVDAPVQLQFDAATNVIDENGPPAAIVVRRLGGQRGELSVRIRTIGDTAQPGLNFDPVDQTLVFGDGEESRLVTLTPRADGVVTPDLKLRLELSEPTGGARLGTPALSEVRIRNADRPPLVQIRRVQAVLDNRRRLTQLIVVLSDDVNPNTARNVKTYRLVAAGRKGAFDGNNAKAIKLASAVYNGRTHSVNLRLKQPLALNQPAQLRINGSSTTGLADTLGRRIDGDHDGHEGGDAIALITRGGVRVQRSNHRGILASL
jgi:hypothetical protein